ELLQRTMPETAYPRLVECALALNDDWSRSVVLGIAARRPARFAEAACASPDVARLEPLLRALGASLARRNQLGPAGELVTTLSQRGTQAAAPAAALLDELARGFDASAKPWPSPRLDHALARLLASPQAELAIAALPLAQRWSESRPVADARRALGARL